MWGSLRPRRSDESAYGASTLTRRTWVALHVPLRAAGIPREFSAAASPPKLVMPVVRSSASTGARSAPRALARTVWDRLPASLAAGAIVWPRVAAQDGLSGPGGGQGRLGAGGDQPGLQLGDGDHLVEHEPAGGPLDLRQVGEPHVDPAL